MNLQLSHEDAAAEITGIPSTVTYTVTENLNSSEGYDTDFAVLKGTGTSQAVAKDEAASDAAKVTAQQQTVTKADNAVTVTNRRVAASPTGVMLSITPYALSAGLLLSWEHMFSAEKNYLEKRNNIMQPMGESQKNVRAANSVVSVFTGCLMAVLFLYGGYSLWDTWRIYHGAFVDDELMELKPVKGEDANPSLQDLQNINADVCAWLTIDDTGIVIR